MCIRDRQITSDSLIKNKKKRGVKTISLDNIKKIKESEKTINMVDSKAKNPAQEAELKIDVQEILENKHLQGNQRDILMLRYGIIEDRQEHYTESTDNSQTRQQKNQKTRNDFANLSLQKVGKKLGITLERVRQIESEAITYLRKRYPDYSE